MLNYNANAVTNENNGLALVLPRVAPVLDPGFRPAVLAHRSFVHQARATGQPVPVRLALEQTDGSVFQFSTEIFPDVHSQSRGNFTFLERLIKTLLWSRGGFRIYFDGPHALARQLEKRWRETPPG